MKISQKEQAKTRAKLISAAVDVITEKGFKAATMREIARKGGVSDATIYNYFPTKEKIIVAYFESIQSEVIETLKSIDKFHTFSLQEQLQTLIETELAFYLPDREFVTIAFERAMQTPISSKSEMAKSRAMFVEAVSDMLDAAIEAGEIPEQPYQGLIPELIADLYLGIIYYWLKDTSERFTNTTQLIDKSLGLLAGILQTGVIAKALDIVSFLFKQHMGTYLEKIIAAAPMAERFNKRSFMDKNMGPTTKK
jgi:AcrR family transcriptional regulator